MSHKRAGKVLNSPYAVLKRPILTEKTHMGVQAGGEPGTASDTSRYTFEVHVKATKVQIKKAVETAFGVKVASVNTMIVKPRMKSFRMVRRGAGTGFTRIKKKAVVRLAKGSKTIELI